MRPEMMIVVNTNFPDCAMPPDAAKANMGHVDFVLPYSSALSLQMMEGSIGENLKDRKYMKAVSVIAAKVR